MAPFRPFTSLRVVVLRARLSEGGGDSDVSEADSFDCVGLREFEVLEEVLDGFAFDARAVRDEVREGALGLGASIEACERLRVGMWMLCGCVDKAGMKGPRFVSMDVDSGNKRRGLCAV